MNTCIIILSVLIGHYNRLAPSSFQSNKNKHTDLYFKYFKNPHLSDDDDDNTYQLGPDTGMFLSKPS